VTVTRPGEITIRNIQKSHEGDFVCVASNVGGNSTYIVSVNVQGKPIFVCKYSRLTFSVCRGPS
jgi:hypothetical protein